MRVLLVRTIAVASLGSLSHPALAGMPIPAPEIGIGMGSMVLIGASYIYLRRRLNH